MEPVVRQMLVEHELQPPPERTTPAEFRAVLLRAFIDRVIDVRQLASGWYRESPSWDEATPVEQDVMVALNEIEGSTDAAKVSELARTLRLRLRDALREG